MRTERFVRRATIVAGALILSLAFALSANAQQAPTNSQPAKPVSVQPAAAKKAPPCSAPLDIVRLAHPLSRFARKIAGGEPITIVAVGSSSTWGAGASTRDNSYPSRLAVELKQHFPGHEIIMINQGVGGEEIKDMVKRFDAVLAAKPDLVLWQLGTNSVVRDNDFTGHAAMIHDGLVTLRSGGAEVVLVDPQFVPKVIARPHAPQMVQLISTAAKRDNVDLFRRYDAMKLWRDADGIPFEAFTDPDGLHMNDWGYACMAKGLGLAIAEAAKRPVLSATALPVSHAPMIDW